MSLPEKHFCMAKITTRDSKSATLGSKSADPSCWTRLMQEIDSYDCVCLTPAPQSSSADVLFSTKAWQGGTDIPLNVCIAANIKLQNPGPRLKLLTSCSSAQQTMQIQKKKLHKKPILLIALQY